MGRGIALLFLGPRHCRWGGGLAPRPGRLYPQETPGTRCTEGWSGRAENLVPTGDSIPDRPTRSHSLYRLSYPTQVTVLYCTVANKVQPIRQQLRGGAERCVSHGTKLLLSDWLCNKLLETSYFVVRATAVEK